MNGGALSAVASNASNILAKVVIHHLGPTVVNDDQISPRISAKVGMPVAAAQVDADVRTLYATGLFANVRVAQESSAEGAVLTYIVQARPRVAEIRFEGNTEVKDQALREKLSFRVGDPLDERKLFADAQRIQEYCQRLGFERTTVKYQTSTDEKSGRSVVTFQISLNRQEAVAPVAPEVLVTTNRDGSVRIWDLATGRLVQSSVSAVTFSPDGRRILTTNADGRIRLWDLAKGTGTSIYSAAFSPDGRLLVTTNTDGSIRVYSPDGQRLGTNQPVFNDPWGNPYIIKGPVRVWDAVTGKEIVTPASKSEPNAKNPGVGVSTQTGVMPDPHPSSVTGIRSDPKLKK